MVLRADETRTKIVCTIGPASRDPDLLGGMIRAGMDVARINFSHGTHDEQRQTIERVRQVSAEEGATVAVLADLQGPKVRIGQLADPVDLARGDWIALTTNPADGSHHVLPFPHSQVIAEAKAERRLLFDDGAIEAVIREVRPNTLVAEVLVGGRLTSRKGVAAPGGTGRVPALTDKDRADARLAVACGVDFVALSFVQTAEDLRVLRSLLDELPGGQDVAIAAKIEKREAIDRLDEILGVADAVIVARGDLGVEVSPQEVPVHQKAIIRRCNRIGVPVVTATQMLESMVERPRPTRAEASDVANAILDGTDAVMLSGETAIGKHPVAAVAMVREISAIVEAQMGSRFDDITFAEVEHEHPVTDAISDATARVAEAVGARLIATSTSSGYTARQVARERPRQAIVALTPRDSVMRQLALVWGVVPVLVSPYEGTDEMLHGVSSTLLDRGYAVRGDRVVVTSGIPLGGKGRTNLLTVQQL
jgi:pyruvate kinase